MIEQHLYSFNHNLIDNDMTTFVKNCDDFFDDVIVETINKMIENLMLKFANVTHFKLVSSFNNIVIFAINKNENHRQRTRNVLSLRLKK